MAKKPAARFVCTNCGAISLSWAGRCAQCGEWNTLQEEAVIDPMADTHAKTSGSALLTESLEKLIKKDSPRLDTHMPQVNDVLGGGIVSGSINLLAGQPGIGKSTLLLQLAYSAAKDRPVLYISAEESAHQVSMRAKRLGTVREQLKFVSSTSADDIAATISESDFKLIIVDSIQSITLSSVTSAAGSVSQITNCAHVLSNIAKKTGTALIIVGHVTKEGAIAGPKVLEHAVDVVMQLEGDRYGGFKVLRAIKNRFGSTSEAGIFEMVENGLQPVSNPSAALLAERQITDGSVVLATLEGTRPLLVEVQALVNKTSYGYPKRAASGIDLNRVNLLVAMLERRTKLSLIDQDIYVNIVGGMRITEPAADLAVCMAIGSATKGLQLKQNAVVFGEVGLSGEVRHVPFTEKRIAEAKKLGFDAAIGPTQKGGKKISLLHGVTDVRTALNQFLEKD
ncbi:MAG TPA: DNA repair protein RadA [Candidatus Saccharimonadales bacterium]|nr:DNA repair protein RadA [Candidatus Saccharimonadales bacterium]